MLLFIDNIFRFTQAGSEGKKEISFGQNWKKKKIEMK